MLTNNQTQKISKRHEMPKKSNVWQNGTDLLSILSLLFKRDALQDFSPAVLIKWITRFNVKGQSHGQGHHNDVMMIQLPITNDKGVFLIKV